MHFEKKSGDIQLVIAPESLINFRRIMYILYKKENKFLLFGDEWQI